MIGIQRAIAINGWMNTAELRWLADQAAKHKHIVEIGCYLGRSTRAMADNTEGVIFAIDNWKGPEDMECDKDNLLPKFLENMEGVLDRIYYFEMDHAFTGKFSITTDMVFIDGDHAYDNVKRDIETWLPKLDEGGLICGHDARLPGVNQAVLETFGYVQIADQTDIWWEIKGDSCQKQNSISS